jgi:hypothetical protein
MARARAMEEGWAAGIGAYIVLDAPANSATGMERPSPDIVHDKRSTNGRPNAFNGFDHSVDGVRTGLEQVRRHEVEAMDHCIHLLVLGAGHTSPKLSTSS